MHRPSWTVRALPAFLAAAILGPLPAMGKGSIQLPPDDPSHRGIIELGGNHIVNCGNILLHLDNRGLIGSAPGSRLPFAGAPSAQWPAGSATEYLYIGGLWVGALKNGEPHVTTAAYQIEWRPGKTELDRIYETREGAPGGARLPAPNADDDQDGKMDEDWLDGRDNDGDGKIDEDFAAVSNQEFFCEFEDTDPAIKANLPDHVPLELHIQQASYCWEDQLVRDFIAFDFRLINYGDAPLDSVCVGFFADCDIGPRGAEDVSNDDEAGFWEGVVSAKLGTQTKNVKLSVGYMFDDDGDEGKSEGYIGLLFLGAQDPNQRGLPKAVGLKNFRFFSGKASFDQGGDPTNDAERYQVLDGSAPRSLPRQEENGFRPEQITKKKDDYRITVSAGKFAELAPGDTLGFQAGLVIGQGFEGMIEHAKQAQLTYDGVYLDCDGDPGTGIQGRETPVCGPANQGLTVRYDPCDSTCDADPSAERCSGTVLPDGCRYVNADCRQEAQTGFKTGIDGKECLIHWLIGTAPPPPKMRLLPRESEVDLIFDNRSETTPDLRLNVIDFESYRIWRADNWKRPFGTDVTTGPGSALWMLLAEYDVPRNNIGSDSGFDDIRYQPNIPDRAVDYYREWFKAHPFQKSPDLPGFNQAALDTARQLARGVRFYRFVDPPFVGKASPNDPPCGANGACPPIQRDSQFINRRCDARGRCRETAPPPQSGAHYFYSVTATDHKLEERPAGSGTLVAVGPGLAGEPNSSFSFVDPPTNALTPAQYDRASDEIYVVPNPASREKMEPWKLFPNNGDPTGTKIEFHHLPATSGKVTIFTLAGDRVKELPFDGRTGNGSLKWDLVSRNGQDVTSGVYLYTVESDDAKFKRFVGKFVVIR
jgi:hypothetical protein